ncbi:hypothetical protein M409DRAFT_56582 [Zasmidium cellare ATCC 36951]|uniref:Uncharacterized protein n=1 Tax=Zasmidium cellare ATCC 36951 TaxID=1080233 RepID=A0A6A6CDK9_ZASCE|nr:uncharacterized protein M409DRAFT_56582 [Zasmidium cellare ATCC 36951]KAF2164300.1 hypothetical protein M409DRAFT_56582 [Zasmidium cellare ATCC 36951]
MGQQQEQIQDLRKQMGRVIAAFWMSKDDEQRDQLLEQKREIQQQIKALVRGGESTQVETSSQQNKTSDAPTAATTAPSNAKPEEVEKQDSETTSQESATTKTAADVASSQTGQPKKRVSRLEREAAKLVATSGNSEEMDNAPRKRVQMGSYAVKDPEPKKRRRNPKQGSP